MASGFFLGGLADSVNAQQALALKSKQLGIQQQYADQEQQRFQAAQYMKLRETAIEHLKTTIREEKNSNPTATDLQIMNSGHVVAAMDMLTGYDQNLSKAGFQVSPNDAKQFAAGFVAGKSQIETEGALARAKEGPLAQQEKAARIKYLESGIPGGTQPAAVKLGLVNSNPDLSPGDELGGMQRVAQAGNTATDVQADVGEQAGQQYLTKNVPDPGEQDLVKSIVNYDTDPNAIAGRVVRGQLKSRREIVISQAMEYAKAKGETYNPRAFKTVQDFLGNGKHGDTVRSLNVVTEHMGTLKELGDALQNGNVQRFNSVAQRWAAETGQSAPTNFQSAVRVVGTELVKALGVSGAGTQADRDELNKNLSVASSPQQVNDAINKVYGPLLSGQLRGLRNQYLSAGGPREKFDKVLLPATKAYIEQPKSEKKKSGDWQVEEIK